MDLNIPSDDPNDDPAEFAANLAKGNVARMLPHSQIMSMALPQVDVGSDKKTNTLLDPLPRSLKNYILNALQIAPMGLAAGGKGTVSGTILDPVESAFSRMMNYASGGMRFSGPTQRGSLDPVTGKGVFDFKEPSPAMTDPENVANTNQSNISGYEKALGKQISEREGGRIDQPLPPMTMREKILNWLSKREGDTERSSLPMRLFEGMNRGSPLDSVTQDNQPLGLSSEFNGKVPTPEELAKQPGMRPLPQIGRVGPYANENTTPPPNPKDIIKALENPSTKPTEQGSLFDKRIDPSNINDVKALFDQINKKYAANNPYTGMSKEERYIAQHNEMHETFDPHLIARGFTRDQLDKMSVRDKGEAVDKNMRPSEFGPGWRSPIADRYDANLKALGYTDDHIKYMSMRQKYAIIWKKIPPSDLNGQ